MDDDGAAATLFERFSPAGASREDVDSALRDANGHAGRAAKKLRSRYAGSSYSPIAQSLASWLQPEPEPEPEAEAGLGADELAPDESELGSELGSELESEREAAATSPHRGSRRPSPPRRAELGFSQLEGGFSSSEEDEAGPRPRAPLGPARRPGSGRPGCLRSAWATLPYANDGLQLRAELEELRWIRELMIGGEAQAVASLLHDVHSRHRCQNAVAESLLREQVQKLLASPQQFRGRRCADLVLGASAETWRVLADWEDDTPTQYERFVNGQARMGAGQMSRLGTEAARIEQLIAAKRDTAWRLLCVAAVGVLAFVQWRALLRACGDDFLDSSE